MTKASVPAPPALVIFDCDGVLIDSEAVFARALMECLVAEGFPVTLEVAMALGFGSNRATLAAAAETRFGRGLPEGFFESFGERAHAAFDPARLAMPGVGALLAALPAPACVASNGHLDRVRRRLSMAGLLGFFDPHVFSAQQVAHGKPAPDLFLYAAERLGVRPDACIVIEDSPTGVAAALAAGMPVVGFCGGSHCGDGHADRLRAAGCDRVIPHMRDLARHLCLADG